MEKIKGKINITMNCECYDKNGNLKWTDKIDLNNDINTKQSKEI